MIIRAILGIVLSGALSAGALYGAGEYLGIRSASSEDIAAMEPAEAEAADVEGVADDEAAADDMTSDDMMSDDAPADEMGEEEPVYDDRLPLPYGAGDDAVWLASTLAGTGPYNVDGESVDLAAMAQEAADGGAVEASCDTSHVAMHCNMTRTDTGIRYSFGFQNTADGGYEVPEGSVNIHPEG